MGMVRPVWDYREKGFVLLLLNYAVLEDHLIAMHVSHATKHVAYGILAGRQLSWCPCCLYSITLKLLSKVESFL